MNARYKLELKPKRGDKCPVCRKECLNHEAEVDAARCFDCMQDEQDFIHGRHELRTILKEAM